MKKAKTRHPRARITARGQRVRKELNRIARPWRQVRDSDKLVIYGLDPLYKKVFRTLAIIRGTDSAEVLAWLLRTHLEVRATIREVKKQTA